MEFQYKIVSSMCKVFPDGENGKDLEEKRLTGLNGETMSFQIAYYWGGDRRKGAACLCCPRLRTRCMSVWSI